MSVKNILITSAGSQLQLVKESIKAWKGRDYMVKVFTCDMNPESSMSNTVGDGCFKVPICTSEDYVETIVSLCLGNDIKYIITMTEREYLILSANKKLFAKYNVGVLDGVDTIR